jgi:hypothetical protein
VSVLTRAVDEYDGVLTAEDLREARRDLRPFLELLADALRDGTLPPGFRKEFLNSPEALSMLLATCGSNLPADFVADAAARLLDPRRARSVVSPTWEDQMRALEGLAANPAAAQAFMSDAATANLLDSGNIYPIFESGEGRAQVADVLEAALRNDADRTGHMRAFTNIVDLVNANENWIDSEGGNGEQFAGLRETPAEDSRGSRRTRSRTYWSAR